MTIYSPTLHNTAQSIDIIRSLLNTAWNRKSLHTQESHDPRRHFLCLVALTFDFDPHINGFSGLMVDHVWVKFGDPPIAAASVFEILCGKTDRQTDT